MINASQDQVKAFTGCLSKAGLAIATTTSQAQISAPNGAGVDYAINGTLYHVADTNNFITLSGTTIPDNSECIFLVCLNAAGTPVVVQGEIVLTADLNSGAKTLKFPQPPANAAVIGTIRITTSGATFVPGTTALTGVATYTDYATLPAYDLTS